MVWKLSLIRLFKICGILGTVALKKLEIKSLNSLADLKTRLFLTSSFITFHPSGTLCIGVTADVLMRG